MHELSVCLAMLDEVARIAHLADAHAVRSVTVRVGPLSGVEAGLLARVFEVARRRTIAEDAKLIFDVARVRVRCMSCAGENEAAPNRLLCARCGSYRTRVVEGDELTLSAVEMDIPGVEASVADDKSVIQVLN
ncbi:MAG: hydrogenase maturation nickel metallochaperone HypA [Xanthobacteraceae bacterium]|nr:hydrogenase maturation nickel metallochaperone HypA [Xanthobacteraceae bacterium]